MSGAVEVTRDTANATDCHISEILGRSNGPTIVGSRFPEQRQSAAEEMLGLVEVVRAAAQFQIGDARRTADAVWLDMMKFQKAAFRAATLRADERAPAAVSRPHRSSDCRRKVARPPDS